jgi:hypothetical protein
VETGHKPLTLKDLWQQVADELFSLDRGLPYTILQLFRAPGATVRRYVLERDPRITRPIRYFLIPGTAFAALTLALRPRLDALTQVRAGTREAAISEFAYDNLLLLAAAGIVVGAIATWIVFRSRRPTLAETGVLSTYANAQGLWINGPMLAALAFGAPSVVSILGGLALFAYNLWIIADYFGGGWKNWLYAGISIALGQVLVGVPIMIASRFID